MRNKAFILDNFMLLEEFKLVIPPEYDHKNRLRLFRSESEKEFYSYDPEITDENFGHTEAQMSPGELIIVKKFAIKEVCSPEECLEFLKGQHDVVFAGGPHALAIVWEQKREALPKGKWTVSLQNKEGLLKGRNGDLRFPLLYRFSGGGERFDLGSFDGNLGEDCCLLCTCKE